MSPRVTWRDRLRETWRRCRRDPAAAWIEFIMLAVVALLVVLMTQGCTSPFRSDDAQGKDKTEAPSHPETSGEAVARLEGELAKAKAIHEEDRLAPLRTTLAWVDGIASLGMLAGVGLAIAAFFFGLGFAWKIPAVIAAGFGAVLAMSLTTSWALGHLPWIIGGVVVVIGAAIAWAMKRHLTLVGAAREAWEHVPPTAKTSDQVDDLMNSLTKAKA